jgi:hypothetical protein
MPPLNIIVEIANLRDQLAAEPDGERRQSLAGRIMALEGQLPASTGDPQVAPQVALPMDPTATQPLKRIRPAAAAPVAPASVAKPATTAPTATVGRRLRKG